MPTFAEFEESVGDEFADADAVTVFDNLEIILGSLPRIDVNSIGDIPKLEDGFQIFCLKGEPSEDILRRLPYEYDAEVGVVSIKHIWILTIGGDLEEDYIGLPPTLELLLFRQLLDSDYHSHSHDREQFKYKGEVISSEETDYADVASDNDLLQIHSVKGGEIKIGGIMGLVTLRKPTKPLPGGIDFNAFDLTSDKGIDDALGKLEASFNIYLNEKGQPQDDLAFLRLRRDYQTEYFGYSISRNPTNFLPES